MILVYCLDENFVQHFLVSLLSLLDHNKDCKVEVYVLNKDITENSRRLVNQSVSDFDVIIHFIYLEPERFKNFLVSVHITIESYFRLVIPEILPAEINRVIYLDCDTVTIGSLKELWHTDMKNRPVAAVPELINNRNSEMGLGNSITYNSGVLLLDLDKWRKENVSGRILGFLHDFPAKIKFHDQDALNAVLVNDVLSLPFKWNLTVPFVTVTDKNKGAAYKKIGKPVIIHFNQTFKPWHYQLRHPFKNLYYIYLNRTPFNGYVQADRNIVTILKKTASSFMILIGLKLN